MILVPNIIFSNTPSWFSHFPSTSDGRKGSEIEILIFRQICILALCSKTSEGPWHPLDITFLEFFCIFITFGSKWLRKTPGWWGFQKIWHLGHPIAYLKQVLHTKEGVAVIYADAIFSTVGYVVDIGGLLDLIFGLFFVHLIPGYFFIKKRSLK